MDSIQLKYNESYLRGQSPKFQDVENQIINIIQTKNEKANHYQKGIQYLELFIDDKEYYFEKHIREVNNSNRILDMVVKSKFKRVYLLSGNHLYVIGIEPEENVKRFNN